MSFLALGAWNMRTLLDRDTIDQHERRTALVAAALARYNINIAAFSETHLAKEGQLTEIGAGYIFYWIEKKH